MSDDCHVEPVHKTATAEELEQSTLIFLAVFGMGCPRCAMRVRNSLLTITGVSNAYVDHLAGMAQVVFNPVLTTVPALLDAVTRAGGDGRHNYWAAYLG
jgi:copper chaperone CopZ